MPPSFLHGVYIHFFPGAAIFYHSAGENTSAAPMGKSGKIRQIWVFGGGHGDGAGDKNAKKTGRNAPEGWTSEKICCNI